MTEFAAIWAQTRNGVIGDGGGVPWPHLSEDLKFFQAVTDGCSVIMGRKTWDSLPEKSKPLPGRFNIVITRDPEWRAPGALHVPSLDAAMREAEGDWAWIIGGGEIYAQAMPHLSSLVVTEIDIDADGDTYAPKIGPKWQLDTALPSVRDNGIDYRWILYRRR